MPICSTCMHARNSCNVEIGTHSPNGQLDCDGQRASKGGNELLDRATGKELCPTELMEARNGAAAAAKEQEIDELNGLGTAILPSHVHPNCYFFLCLFLYPITKSHVHSSSSMALGPFGGRRSGCARTGICKCRSGICKCLPTELHPKRPQSRSHKKTSANVCFRLCCS